MPVVSRTDEAQILAGHERRIAGLERAPSFAVVGTPQPGDVATWDDDAGIWIPARTTPVSWTQTFLKVANLSTMTLFAQTIPAKSIGQFGAIDLEVGAYYTSGIPLGGFDQYFTVEVVFGGTSLWKATTPAMPSVANDRAWRVAATLVNELVASQRLTGLMTVSDHTPPADGLGSLGPDEVSGTVAGVSFVDTDASDQDLVVKLTFETLVQQMRGYVRAVLFPAPVV